MTSQLGWDDLLIRNPPRKMLGHTAELEAWSSGWEWSTEEAVQEALATAKQ